MWIDIAIFLIQHSMYSFWTNSHLPGGAWICRRSLTFLMYYQSQSWSLVQSFTPISWSWMQRHTDLPPQTLQPHLWHFDQSPLSASSGANTRLQCWHVKFSTVAKQTVVPAGTIHPYHPCTWSVSCPFWWHETSSCASYRQSTTSRQFFSGFHHLYIKFSAWPCCFINNSADISA